jgi:hypothetical protein
MRHESPPYRSFFGKGGAARIVQEGMECPGRPAVKNKPFPAMPARKPSDSETEDPSPGEKKDYDPEDFPPEDEADREGGNAGPEKKREP